jgi:hypothetical protein
MRTTKSTRRQKSRRRSGTMSIEVALSLGVMIPVCGGLLLGGTKICFVLYQAINSLVSWPFL